MQQPDSFRHLGGGRKGLFLILRYVFIAAASYLLIFQAPRQTVRSTDAFMIAVALASNVAFSWVSPTSLFAWYVEAPILIADTLWVSWALQSTGQIGGEFFLLYFFVLLIAATGESTFMVLLGSALASLANVYFVREGMAWTSPVLLRVAFFFAVALFYGHVLGEIKRERLRADRGLAWAKELEARVAERTADLQRLYDASLSASRAKSEFVANMSHELRTPLHIILGYTEMLIDRASPRTEGERQGVVVRIREAAAGLLHLVENVLQLGKFEAGTVVTVNQPVRLAQFAADLQRAERLPVAPGVALRWQVSPDLPVIHTDPAKLTLALNNLIENAIKFTRQGTIAITVRNLPQENEVEFRIDDTGPGIDEGHLQTIFEPFRQVDSTANGHGGVGLGLAIVRRHVDLLEGKLSVQSAPGHGSTFTVRLPYRTTAEDAVVTPKEPRRVGRRRAGLEAESSRP